MRRLVVLAAALCLIAPAAADAATVTMVSEETGEVTVDLAGAEPDVRDTTYTVGNGSRTVASGWSVDLALQRAGIDPYRFKSFEVSTGGEGGIVLASGQITRAGSGPRPVFYEDGDGMHFIRPAGDDGSGGDLLSGNITVRAKKESALAVAADADDDEVAVDDLVRFHAEAVSKPAGEDVTYKWVFGDGETASGPKVRHRYAKRGTYSVLVQMTTPSDDVGVSDVVRVKVGDPPAEGPDREGGGTNTDAGAPTSGAADGAGGSGVAVGTGSSGGSASAPPAEATSEGANEPASNRDRDPQPVPEPEGETVTGRLLSSTAPPVVSPQREVAARTGTPRDKNEPTAVPEWVWAVLAVLALVGTGWAIDGGRLARLNWGTPSQ